MGWDVDGTIYGLAPWGFGAVALTTYQMEEWPQADKVLLNDTDSTTVPTPTNLKSPSQGSNPPWVWWHFPQARDIDGFFIHNDQPTFQSPQFFQTIEYTAESAGAGNYTPNAYGPDVRWDTDPIGPTFPVDGVPAVDAYRLVGAGVGWFAVSQGDCRLIRMLYQRPGNAFNAQFILENVHIYGGISAGVTPTRMIWVDNTTGLEWSGVNDWGDRPRGSIEDRDVRLLNNSGGSIATDIDLIFESLPTDAPAVVSDSWYTFSVGGDAFAPTKNIGSIGPGALSAVITIRQNIPDTAASTVYSARARVDVNTWV